LVNLYGREERNTLHIHKAIIQLIIAIILFFIIDLDCVYSLSG